MRRGVRVHVPPQPQKKDRSGVRRVSEPSLCCSRGVRSHPRSTATRTRAGCPCGPTDLLTQPYFRTGRLDTSFVPAQNKPKRWALERCCRTESLLRSTPNKTHKASGRVNIGVAVAAQEGVPQRPAEPSPPPLNPPSCAVWHRPRGTRCGVYLCARGMGQRTPRCW